MKKILSIFALCCCLTSFAQDGRYIIEDCTDLGGKCYIFPSENLIVTNAEKNKGFTISADFRRKGTEGNLHMTGLLCQLVNIGTCCEKNELIFLFEDGSKMTLVSWNKWNCEGNAWYNLDEAQREELATKKLVKAQMKNGYSFESFVNTIPNEQQDYFMTLASDAAQNKVQAKK